MDCFECCGRGWIAGGLLDNPVTFTGAEGSGVTVNALWYVEDPCPRCDGGGAER